jgi:phosphopantothenoylcysteine synthetase/decarboxylase
MLIKLRKLGLVSNCAASVGSAIQKKSRFSVSEYCVWSSMRVLITAGPSSEPIDSVRTITNRSTGELGATLAQRFIDREHQVEIFLGEGATQSIARAIRFQTNADLERALRSANQPDKVDLFLHAAALTDFGVDAIRVDGREVVGFGKLDSSVDAVELVLRRQPKLIGMLRSLFPRALIVGWKFEVAISISGLLAEAQKQIAVNRTDACVVNGPAFAAGFGFCDASGLRASFATKAELARYLVDWSEALIRS